ncbi:hypothetical protein GUJ93_ZPchr0005g14970 [Zizania palustris]|uniref:Uncharacterized protein n=1 Tax=Zizania palustris TaxID=103762 RepID=A0A8J5T579_ZIZPA|nr:hypothetical protein GUJ93_ZPchr0005g14970 [Zizania palustris]
MATPAAARHHHRALSRSGEQRRRWRGGVRCSSPAQEFATLASVFRRRLVVGASTTAAAAVGANFGGVTSFLLGLSPAGPAASPSRHTANSRRFGGKHRGMVDLGQPELKSS